MEEKILQRFEQNVEYFLDDCIEIIEHGNEKGCTTLSPTMAQMLIPVVKSFEMKVIMDHFIENTYSHWDEIYNRNIDYFKEQGLALFTQADEKGLLDKSSNQFIKKFGNDNLRKFKELLEAKYMENGKEMEILDKERQDAVLDVLRGCVNLSLHYIEAMRKNQYYMNFVDLEKYQKMFLKK